MNAQTKMSEKGQVVIPKDVRDRLSLKAGDFLDVIERPDGVLLKVSPKSKSDRGFAEITAKIRSHFDYDGPPVSIEDMNAAIADMWRGAAARSDRAGD
jgi:AbrB family looped-hinge helix DNA binding protein